MQKFNVQLTIPVSVPEDMVLIHKVELERLEESDLSGSWWTMQDMANKVKMSDEWIKENILYNPQFKKVLDVRNGGFVYYPERRGERWRFLAKKMSLFLEDNFSEIFSTRAG